jgi:hypothetical protein
MTCAFGTVVKRDLLHEVFQFDRYEYPVRARTFIYERVGKSIIVSDCTC